MDGKKAHNMNTRLKIVGTTNNNDSQSSSKETSGESLPISAPASVEAKRLKQRHFKESANFLADFNPLESRREIQKLKTLTSTKPKKVSIYDSKGVLIDLKIDACDCLQPSCPGCHFPCRICKSAKCGQVCRRNRGWQFDTINIENDPKPVKTNQNVATRNGN